MAVKITVFSSNVAFIELFAWNHHFIVVFFLRFVKIFYYSCKTTAFQRSKNMVESNETWSDKHKWIDHARRKNTFFSKMFLYSWQTTNIICIFFCFSSSVSLIFASTSSASHSDLSMYSCYIVYVSIWVYVYSQHLFTFSRLRCLKILWMNVWS